MEFISHSPEETVQIGQRLGKRLAPGMVLLLRGDLGAGKTHFAKGIALGLEVDEMVTSPTFTIINEYNGRLPFYHIDTYRLEEEEEAYGIGLEEYMYGQGVTLIEWPERVTGLLPDTFLTVSILYEDEADDVRILRFLPTGEAYEEIIEELNSIVHSGN